MCQLNSTPSKEEIMQYPYVFAFILIDSEKEVKRDIPSICIVFLTDISAYLEEPLNTSLKGPSGIGKTYVTMNTLKYFPEKDVMLLGGISPKSFIHEKGVLMDENNEPILSENKPVKPLRRRFPNKEKYEEALRNYSIELGSWNERIRNSYRLIDLSNKIIIFLESPSEDTIHMLYPILSHDKERIEYKWVEEMVTRKAIIKGFPAVIFLSAQQRYMEELYTRILTGTPESGKEKIEDANILTNVKIAFPWEYEGERELTRIIKEIILTIKEKLVSENFRIVIPFVNLHEMFPKDTVRDMRDFQHFSQFLKALTSLHLFQRPILKTHDKFYVLCSVDDVVTSMCIFSKIFETTRTGMEANILKFYHEIVKRQGVWHKTALTHEYNNVHKKKVSGDTIGYWLRRLSEIGYVDIRQDDTDKRKNIYEPLVTEEEKLELVRNLGNREELRLKLEEGFKEWLKKDLGKKEFFQYRICNGQMKLVELELDDVKHLISKNSFRNIPPVLHSIYKQISVLESKEEPEETGKVENHTISESIKCPICSCDLDEEHKVVEDYIICSACYNDYTSRGYGSSDIVEVIKQMLAIRSRRPRI